MPQTLCEVVQWEHREERSSLKQARRESEVYSLDQTAMSRIGSRRLLHVLPSPSTSIPTSLNVSHLVKSVPELNNAQSVPALSSFEVIDSTLLRVGLAPSTALYTKRNTLLASFGDSLISNLYLRKFFSRLWSFQRPFGYQKLISVVPVSALISSSQPLAVLTLDGTIDWVIAKGDALHTFTGERLLVDAKRKPWFSKNGPAFSHTFVTGRGTVALSGQGSLYKITLEEGESFLALKDTLVAYSFNANNKSIRQPRITSLAHKHELLEEKQQFPDIAVVEQPKTSIWEHIRSTLSFAAETFAHILHADGGKYVRLEGPTTMILQSRPNKFTVPDLVEPNLNSNPLEHEVSATARAIVENSAQQLDRRVATGMMGSPEHHLKIATVRDGKVVFESTSNFDRF